MTASSALDQHEGTKKNRETCQAFENACHVRTARARMSKPDTKAAKKKHNTLIYPWLDKRHRRLGRSSTPATPLKGATEANRESLAVKAGNDRGVPSTAPPIPSEVPSRPLAAPVLRSVLGPPPPTAPSARRYRRRTASLRVWRGWCTWLRESGIVPGAFMEADVVLL